VRVLYVSHTAEISGAEHSLLSLLGALPDTVQPLLATPRGALRDAAAEIGIPTSTITGTAGSLRLHPLHTPRTLAELSRAALQIRVAARRHRAELIHANSTRAGISLALGRARRGGMPATVVHVRDCLPPSLLTSATMRLIAASASSVVANSAYTARWVLAAAARAHVEVVHNPVDLARWDPDRIDRAQARVRLGVAGSRELLLGVVAQLSPWKGQDTAIEALRLLREQGVDAHLLLIGSAKFVARSTRLDNNAYVARLRERIAQAGLEDRVSWLGERDDVPELMRALDILLLPSEQEPFGRALIEAMAMEVPVLATNVGGPPEIVEEGREGHLLPPGEPLAWTRAVRAIVQSPDRGREMGLAGRRRVQREFSAEHHSGAMIGVYERAIARAGGSSPAESSSARPRAGRS
jgi:L-malate glycosyltransferase